MPVTRRRGTDVSSGFAKGEPPVDSGEQADKAWLLDIQRKLYTWSRNHPGEVGRICGVGSPALVTSGSRGGASRAIAALVRLGWTR